MGWGRWGRATVLPRGHVLRSGFQPPPRQLGGPPVSAPGGIPPEPPVQSSARPSGCAHAGRPATRPEPFIQRTAPAALEDLRARLRATRWPDTPEDAGWSLGTDLDHLRELVTYWAESFDRPAREAALSALPRFRVRRADSGSTSCVPGPPRLPGPCVRAGACPACRALTHPGLAPAGGGWGGRP
ncbi:epoxide hydrolase N-terminal domain-containing protein, partial [Streptomyces atroolivaceus]|uniref:epoxide hydrolase N-terminal domain-containing protein n=1 Tax=Streptomyces atroolivaceus TaxID=66869 RepID=UPI0033EAA3AD